MVLLVERIAAGDGLGFHHALVSHRLGITQFG